ncbi:hypothetical protein BDY19DRAFT_998582 [Irpex rosettiformis]|uniref:Uncharacterized protein n=1 Tax=Irpex rosettiformis TaxID=378272 RepID=A0ACB8TN69_9APHY|nr:hypothetical protein BDY19DRAFT_998582 [Irpex rosettiformis]
MLATWDQSSPESESDECIDLEQHKQGSQEAERKPRAKFTIKPLALLRSPSTTDYYGTPEESKEDGVVVKTYHQPPAPPPSTPVPPPASVPPSMPGAGAPSTPKQHTQKVSFGEALKKDGEDPNGEGKDSDNDMEQDVPATPGAAKKKSVRGRRGKKRLKAIVINGMHSSENREVEGGEEQEINGEAKGESQLVLVKSTVAPPAPLTSLVVSEEILGVLLQAEDEN